MAFALITGASKGIGKALAWELAARNYNLLLVSRSEHLLKEVAAAIKQKHPVSVDTFSIDLSGADAALKIKNWCLSNHYNVSVLVNNAGYGLWGDFEKISLEDQMNMMTLNMQSVVRLTYEMLPILRKESAAFILNVSSTAAYQAVPTLSIYAATKSFVLLFTRGLRHELINSTVSVTCLSPGATSTEFMDRAGMESSLKEKAKKFEMSAEAVAKIAVRGMLARRAEIIPGFTNYLSAQLASMVPKKLTETIAAGLYKTKK